MIMRNQIGGVGGALTRAGRGVVRTAKKGGRVTFRGFLAVHKLALRGMCALPGPARSAAIAAALTAATGGAGVVASAVSEQAAEAVCKAMRSNKPADLAKAQQALTQSTGVAFRDPSLWERIKAALGL